MCQGWSILLQAQQVLIAANQFAMDLNRCLKTRSNMQWIYDQMKQLDAWTSSSMKQANAPPTVPRSGDMSIASEFDAATSIRTISRIKLARYVRSLGRKGFTDLGYVFVVHRLGYTNFEPSPTFPSLSKNILIWHLQVLA